MRGPRVGGLVLGAAALLGLGARGQDRPRGARLPEVVVEGQASTARRLQAHDASPAFVGEAVAASLFSDVGLPPRPFDAEAAARVVVEAVARRRGAAADGESRLVLTVWFEEPADAVAFSLEGPGALAAVAGGRTFPVRLGDRTRHYAFATYRAPEGLGTPERSLARGGQSLDARTATVEARWGAERAAPRAPGGAAWPRLELDLVRPPVVLVHGTYDTPEGCWDWDEATDEAYRAAPPPYRTPSLRRQLERAGFVVFLVDYRHSNGKGTYVGGPTELATGADPEALHPWRERQVLPSHFRDNARVLWDGLRREDPRHSAVGPLLRDDHVGGIAAALRFLRERVEVAAIQADVVGHSMGGVLARVYVRGQPLPDCGHALAADTPAGGWYRRPDNFQQGDVNRLLTIGSTHRGSEISGLLRHYVHAPASSLPDLARGDLARGFVQQVLREEVGAAAFAVLNASLEGQLADGAFADQAPGSEAYRALGPTPVPAHAIATAALPADLVLFPTAWKVGVGPASRTFQGGDYDLRLVKLWSILTPTAFVEPLFAGRLGQPEAAAELVAMVADVHSARAQRDDVQAAIDRAQRDRVAATYDAAAVRRLEARLADLDVEVRAQLQRSKLRYWAASFGDDWNDCVVSVRSAKGGLERPYVTLLPAVEREAAWAGRAQGILHGYQPRHRDVQARVLELLRGGLEAFDPRGFPASTTHRPLRPAEATFRPHEARAVPPAKATPPGGR